MPKIKLKIITPERIAYESEVDSIQVSTKNGEVGILPRHIPLVSIIKPGGISIKKGKEELLLAVSGGVLEVKPFSIKEDMSQVIVLADNLEFSSEIDIPRAKEAYERAQKVMLEKQHVLDVDFARIQSKIEKELNRIKIGGKYRK